MTEWNGENRRASDPQGWHLKKEVNLSIIISIVGVGIACVTGYTDLRKDIELIKADQAVLHQADNRMSTDMKDDIRLLQDQISRMDAKLDRLIERSK